MDDGACDFSEDSATWAAFETRFFNGASSDVEKKKGPGGALEDEGRRSGRFLGSTRSIEKSS